MRREDFRPPSVVLQFLPGSVGSRDTESPQGLGDQPEARCRGLLSEQMVVQVHVQAAWPRERCSEIGVVPTGLGMKV